MKRFICIITCVFCITTTAFADANRDLLSAAEDGKLSEVQQAIAAGADVNIQNNEGKTALGLLDDDKYLLQGKVYRDGKYMSASDVSDKIQTLLSDLKEISDPFKQSHWKTVSGNFNGARLASDSIAMVVLGTAGGLITSNVIKKNQTKHGFKDLKCTISGQVVSDYGDEFYVGAK